MVLFDLTMHDAEAGLAGLNRRLEALGAHYRWPTRAQGALQVGLDEWISNIIQHGYRDTGGRGPVRVVVAVSAEATGKASGAQAGVIFARVEDWGPGFDPMRVRVAAGGCSGGLNASLHTSLNASLDASLSALLGQGLRLLRHLCSGLRYHRSRGCNRLSLQVPA